MATTVTPTNAGLNLLRDALNSGTVPQVQYVALGTGCGVLGTGLTNGQAGITALAMAAGIPFALTNGQSLTLMNGLSSQVVTTTGAAQGATSIPVNSFTANAAYPASTSSVTPTPLATDTTLHNEVFRKAITSVANGANPGEGLINGYISPQDTTGTVISEVAWFAGTSASATANSGVMIGRGLYNHQHTNTESIQSQLDSTI